MGLTSFSEFLKGQDVFGHPVTINYRGEDAYNTAWGAFLTIVQKVFFLVIAVMGVLDLLAHKDPNIVQYTIYDKRNDDSELNLAENKGGFIFAIGNELGFYPYQRYLDVQIVAVENKNGAPDSMT